MKKPVLLILIMFMLCSCNLSRQRYHVFSFDNYTLAPGFDDVSYLKITFDFDIDETIAANQEIDDIKLYFWENYFANVDVINRRSVDIESKDAIVKKLDFYLQNYEAESYKLNGVELKSSVKENCEIFNGEYIFRNAPACIIVKKADGRNNVAILHGDIINADQDELYRVEIYVE